MCSCPQLWCTLPLIPLMGQTLLRGYLLNYGAPSPSYLLRARLSCEATSLNYGAPSPSYLSRARLSCEATSSIMVHPPPHTSRGPDSPARLPPQLWCTLPLIPLVGQTLLRGYLLNYGAPSPSYLSRARLSCEATSSIMVHPPPHTSRGPDSPARLPPQLWCTLPLIPLAGQTLLRGYLLNYGAPSPSYLSWARLSCEAIPLNYGAPSPSYLSRARLSCETTPSYLCGSLNEISTVC